MAETIIELLASARAAGTEPILDVTGARPPRSARRGGRSLSVTPASVA